MKVGTNASGIIIFAYFRESMNNIWLQDFWIDTI
jgi:hypothetical protein